MNKVILCGNLTKDPELTFTQGKGTAVCKFGLAVRRDKDTADFINCVAFNKPAETIANYFTKGSKILIEGSLQVSVVDKDGKKTYYTSVIIHTFEFVEKKSGGNQQQDISTVDFGVEVTDQDIPF